MSRSPESAKIYNSVEEFMHALATDFEEEDVD